ncbi:MAG: PIN domain-containing protein [Myxococcales bacterium]|nr:PIN domain-containing protein [Myxococcales bacterium]
MPFIVIYDACVLFSPSMRDLLIRIAQTSLVQAKWTDEILNETFRAVLRERPRVTADQLGRTRSLMNAAVPDCLVTGYEDLVEGIRLPDMNDRHVLAAAVRAGAQSIVTANAKDFPADALRAYNIEALTPDEFMMDMLDLDPALVIQILHEQAAALRNPPRTVLDVLTSLRRSGFRESVAKIHELLERLES